MFAIEMCFLAPLNKDVSVLVGKELVKTCKLKKQY